MPKVNIAGIDINTDAHKDNSPEHRAAIFAHLQGEEKEKAVLQLEKELSYIPSEDAKAKDDDGGDLKPLKVAVVKPAK